TSWTASPAQNVVKLRSSPHRYHAVRRSSHPRRLSSLSTAPQRTLADICCRRLHGLAARADHGRAEVIRIDQLWLCTAPMDMRAGAERLMSCVVQTTGAACAHHGYLFANARATRIKLLVHDGFGVWCAARRLNAGH